jgi:dTDP-L-rhamnose 4-epimerase
MRPVALHPDVELRHADITENSVWDTLLGEMQPQVIVHLAAETGTGQSLTEAARHAKLNVYGTAVMLDALTRHAHTPRQILLTSSRAVYGEGAWRRSNGEIFYPGQRDRDQLAGGRWDFYDAQPIPFCALRTEPRPTSIYGSTKLAQEHVIKAWAIACGCTLTIARLQNVYGPGQSLINPYTGIVSLFAKLAMKGESIPLYEDGLMRRDFVYIEDTAEALLRAIDRVELGSVTLDIGSGEATTIREVAEFMASRYRAPKPHVSGGYRQGDVRHASCDVSVTASQLMWTPNCHLAQGLEALCQWIDQYVTGAD